MTRAAAPLAVLALLVLAPPAAAHGVLSVDGTTLRYSDSDGSSVNTTTISPVSAGRVRFDDPTAFGGMTPGNAQDRCVPLSETRVECDMRGLDTIRVDVGPNRDKVSYQLDGIKSQLIGREGDDEITAAGATDSIYGGEGNDRLTGGAGRDVMGGDAGDDELSGGDDNDLVQGGQGTDGVDGGAGDDELRVRDGVGDRIACGEGGDRVIADEADVAGPEQGCEAVERAAATAADDVPLPGGGGGSEDRIGANRPLRVRVGGSTYQRATGRLRIAATATRAAMLTATGTVTAGGRRYRLQGSRARVAVAGGGARLSLRLPAGARAAVRRAVRSGRTARALVRVTARDASGARARARMAPIRLRA